MQRIQALGGLLERHLPYDQREEGFISDMRTLLTAGPTCLSRSHFDPGHFTASAFVLSPDGAALLLILHAKLGLWLQPGGHVEPDDSDLEQAARREAREEVSLVELVLAHPGIFDVDVHEIPAGRDPAHLHFDVRFLFRSVTTQVTAASDAKDARWVPLGEVGAAHSDESVMRAVRRIGAI